MATEMTALSLVIALYLVLFVVYLIVVFVA